MSSVFAKFFKKFLSVYDFSVNVEEDLFGNLMIQLADRSQRLLLGQELTPSWLSNMIVRKTMSMLHNGEMPIFVDMCCGSGSMVVSMLRLLQSMLSECTPEEKQKIVMKSITGFDIDPLAVILAKINWVIAANNIIDFNPDIYIPIYHADSLFIQSPISIQKDSCMLQLHDEYISIPLFLVRDSTGGNLFDSVLDVAYDCIHAELSLDEVETLLSSFSLKYFEINITENELYAINYHYHLVHLAIEELLQSLFHFWK